MAACAQQAFTAAVMEKRKRQVHIDQDLHVYCRDRDLFFRRVSPPPSPHPPVSARTAFQSLVSGTEEPDANVFIALRHFRPGFTLGLR